MVTRSQKCQNYEIRPIPLHPEVIKLAKIEAQKRGISVCALYRRAICAELRIPEPEVRAYRIRKVKATA